MGAAAEIKKGRKFDQVLDGARAVFMRDGYEGASVDDIAREARVSKATLYAYCPNKQHLFFEVARAECSRQSAAAFDDFETTVPIREALTEFARRLTCFFLTDFGQDVYRICVAESFRFPELGIGFYEAGPLMVRARLAAVLAPYVDRGELHIEDMELATAQFGGLCKVDLFEQYICQVSRSFTDDQKQRVIEGVVDMFLARYGV